MKLNILYPSHLSRYLSIYFREKILAWQNRTSRKTPLQRFHFSGEIKLPSRALLTIRFLELQWKPTAFGARSLNEITETRIHGASDFGWQIKTTTARFSNVALKRMFGHFFNQLGKPKSGDALFVDGNRVRGFTTEKLQVHGDIPIHFWNNDGVNNLCDWLVESMWLTLPH